MNNIKCLRCDLDMSFLRREKLQLGQTGWILGDLPNLFAGSMEVNIYLCPKCRKVELFLPEDVCCDAPLPQKRCPKCGTLHDFDYPKCPNCKFDYSSR